MLIGGSASRFTRRPGGPSSPSATRPTHSSSVTRKPETTSTIDEPTVTKPRPTLRGMLGQVVSPGVLDRNPRNPGAGRGAGAAFVELAGTAFAAGGREPEERRLRLFVIGPRPRRPRRRPRTR